MEVKTILLLMIVLHTCTADSGFDEDGFAVTTANVRIKNNPPYQRKPGKDPELRRSNQPHPTDLPAGSGYSYQNMPVIPGGVITGHGNYEYEERNIISHSDRRPDKYEDCLHDMLYTSPIPEEIYEYSEMSVNSTAHLCNSTVRRAVKHNWTKTSREQIIISKEAVHFLKGSLVTRVMPSFYILIFVISLPLNALALLTFTCKIKEKKPAVIYMLNLACVDLLFTLLLPLKIHYHLNGSHWVFGEAMCRVLTSAFYCYMYCSILLMMCMSVDRLMAVVVPIASLTWRSKRNSVYVCALVWLLALAGTIPLLSITQTFNIKDVGDTCHDVLHQDDPANQKYVFLFSILSCLYFFLPLVVTLACYSTILHSLSAKSGRLATSSSSSDNRRRAVIMTIAVLIEFVVCFASTNGILLYHCVLQATRGVGKEGNTSYMAYMLAVCAGSSSVFLNPLLYYYGSSQCRQQIRSVLKWRKKQTMLSNT